MSSPHPSESHNQGLTSPVKLEGSDRRESPGGWKRRLPSEEDEDRGGSPSKRLSPSTEEREHRRSLYWDPTTQRYSSPSGTARPLVVIRTPTSSASCSRSGTVPPPDSRGSSKGPEVPKAVDPKSIKSEPIEPETTQSTVPECEAMETNTAPPEATESRATESRPIRSEDMDSNTTPSNTTEARTTKPKEIASKSLELRHKTESPTQTSAPVKSESRKNNSTSDFVERFKNATSSQKMIWWVRREFQRILAKIKEGGPSAFTSEDFTSVKNKLLQLSYYDFASDQDFFRETKIQVAVKLLKDSKKFGDEIADMATELFDRWSAGKLGPAPLESGVFDDIDDSDDEIDLDDGAAGTGIVRIQRLSDGARQLMRGIITERTNRVSHRLDPNDPNKRDAAIFGDNGLTVGQWWPYQICALRDGAHGARQGGIYGREVEGTYSIVTSAESKYSDTDRGDSLYYSGSHDDPVNDNDTAAQLTKNTRLLMRSITTRRPVRVIRKGPGKRNSYYPRCGFRYDGLYRVVSYNIESGSGGQRDFYQFHLVRCPGQVPLTDPSVAGHPSRSEYELYLELTGRR